MNWENDEMRLAYAQWGEAHPLRVEAKLQGHAKAKAALCALIDVLEADVRIEFAEWDLVGIVRYSIEEKRHADARQREKEAHYNQ